MFRRYALVRQSDERDGTAAALATIARHHRRPIDPSQVAALPGTDLLGLLRAAESLGFSARAARAPYEALARTPVPAIAQVRDDRGVRFVVLHRAGKGRVVLADPAGGIRKLSRDEFCRCWTGYLLVVSPDRAGVGPRRRLLGLLAPHARALAGALLGAVLLAVLCLAAASLLRHLGEVLLDGGETRLLHALAAGLALLLAFHALFGLLREHVIAHVGDRIGFALLADYTHRLLCLPLGSPDLRRPGEALACAGDVSRVREAARAPVAFALDGVLAVALLAALFACDLSLALVASAFLPALAVAPWLARAATTRHLREASAAGADLADHLVEDLSAAETIRAFGAERLRRQEGEGHIGRVLRSVSGGGRLGRLLDAHHQAVLALLVVAALWHGGCRVLDGAMTPGWLMFCGAVLGFLLGPLARLASAHRPLREGRAALERLGRVMDAEPEEPDAPRKAAFRGLELSLQLRDVSFRYGPGDKVLDRVNLVVPAGKTVAIVGESGSGKSTLLRLLMGLHPPAGGRVRADGVDLHDYQQASLRARIALVPHDPVIFRGTLRENVALARPDATLDEVMAAVGAAGLEELIARLPCRYETDLGPGGTHLSRGERQRLAIARVLLRGPDVVLLDEVMSPPEGAAEQMIRHNLRARLAGKTVVVTARSLSAVRDVDLIYLLHRGQVVAEGTYAEMAAREGGQALPVLALSGPSPEVTARHERRILELYMEGHSEGTIALELGAYDRSVRRVLERMRALVEIQGFEGLFGSLSASATRRVEPPPAPEPPHPSSFDLLMAPDETPTTSWRV